MSKLMLRIDVMNKKSCQISTSDLILCVACCQATWNICRLLGNSYNWQTASSTSFSPIGIASPPGGILILDLCVCWRGSIYQQPQGQTLHSVIMLVWGCQHSPSCHASLLKGFSFLSDISRIGLFSCHLPLSAMRRMQIKIQLITKEAIARVSFVISF